MWQVQTLPHVPEVRTNDKIVCCELAEGMLVVFEQLRGAPVFISIYSGVAEPRVFDKARLPIITVDGEQLIDLNKEMDYERTHGDWYFSEDKKVGARIWSGEDRVLLPTFTIAKLMMGKDLHVRAFFDPFTMAEYNTSLIGFADAFQQAFGVGISSIGQSSVSDGEPTWRSTPDVRIDRAAIRSMVEDHWRSLILISTPGNTLTIIQFMQDFTDRLLATAALMEPHKADIFLNAAREERELVENEFKTTPDLLSRRLGLTPAIQPTLVTHHHQYQREGIGEMVVRTAIRATIWEAVFALFRR